MASFNKVILAGNLTRDPELRYTPKGTAVARIGLACNRKWKSETGEMKEEVTFVDVDAFGKTAETIGQYLKKGRPVFIEGRLQLDTWDDKTTGQKRSKLKVVGEAMQLMGSRGGGEGGEGPGSGGGSSGGGAQRSAPPSRPAPQKPPADPDLEPEEDDIPF